MKTSSKPRREERHIHPIRVGLLKGRVVCAIAVGAPAFRGYPEEADIFDEASLPFAFYNLPPNTTSGNRPCSKQFR
jgi:hypothetical protein